MRILIVVFMLAGVLTGCGCETIDTGHRGVKTNFGKLVGDPLDEGLYFYNPFTENVVELSVREGKLENKTECFTKDTQKVSVSYALSYYPDPKNIHKMYQQFGHDWDEKVIPQVVLGALKDTTGQWIADDLVSKREQARDSAFEEIKSALASRGVIATRLDLVNLDFDDAYEKAVEAKVVAVQRAAEAKNQTVQIEENAKQKVIAAEAEAKSMQIRSKALEANKGLVEYEAVQKWDGKLPQYMLGGTTPFINLK